VERRTCFEGGGNIKKGTGGLPGALRRGGLVTCPTGRKSSGSLLLLVYKWGDESFGKKGWKGQWQHRLFFTFWYNGCGVKGGGGIVFTSKYQEVGTTPLL